MQEEKKSIKVYKEDWRKLKQEALEKEITIADLIKAKNI